MSRDDAQRLDDIAVALEAIKDHLSRGELRDGMVFDAVCMRLIEIGEAAKGLSLDRQAQEPDIPWAQIAGLRNHLAYRYFDTAFSVISSTVAINLGPLGEAVGRLRDLA